MAVTTSVLCRSARHAHRAERGVNPVAVHTGRLPGCMWPWRLSYGDDELLLFSAFVFTLHLKKLGAHIQAWNGGLCPAPRGPGLNPAPLPSDIPPVPCSPLWSGAACCLA